MWKDDYRPGYEKDIAARDTRLFRIAGTFDDATRFSRYYIGNPMLAAFAYPKGDVGYYLTINKLDYNMAIGDNVNATQIEISGYGYTFSDTDFDVANKIIGPINKINRHKFALADTSKAVQDSLKASALAKLTNDEKKALGL